MANKTPHTNIHDALQLNGDPDVITDYYRRWSRTYDDDVVENYYGIDYICELLHDSFTEHQATDPAVAQIVDVGCGTGLLGKPLHKLGYRLLDGIDLSPEMADKARETGYYRTLHSGININQALPKHLHRSYDAVICLGTYTPGHVEPESLHQLAALVRPSGLIVLSTRIPYYDTTRFQQVSDELEADHTLSLLTKIVDAPYRDDGNAHYWAYRVL